MEWRDIQTGQGSRSLPRLTHLLCAPYSVLSVLLLVHYCCRPAAGCGAVAAGALALYLRVRSKLWLPTFSRYWEYRPGYRPLLRTHHSSTPQPALAWKLRALAPKLISHGHATKHGDYSGSILQLSSSDR